MYLDLNLVVDVVVVHSAGVGDALTFLLGAICFPKLDTHSIWAAELVRQVPHGASNCIPEWHSNTPSLLFLKLGTRTQSSTQLYLMHESSPRLCSFPSATEASLNQPFQNPCTILHILGQLLIAQLRVHCVVCY